MSYVAPKPEQSTSIEASALTNLTNLGITPSGYFIVKTGQITFSNILNSSLTNPMTSTGDMIYGDSGVGLPVRLPIGTSGQILTVTGGLPVWANPATSAGTVTSVSVATANGFAGTVATSTTTPAITISTTVTGLLKGNGTAISVATAGSDYAVGSLGLVGGQTIAGGTLTTQGLTLRANAADTTTGTIAITTSTTSTSTSTGALTIAGGLGVAGTTFLASANVGNLTASQAVVTDASKNLASLSYTAVNTPSTIVSRDANGNASFVNVIATNISIVTSAQTINLTAGSAQGQIATGSSTIIFNLPDATTCYLGQTYTFDNDSTGGLTVNLNDGTTLVTVVPAGGYATIICSANGTTNGVWHTYYSIPDTVNKWGTAGLTTGSQITSTLATGTAPFVVASTTAVANLSIGGNAATATSATNTTNIGITDDTTTAATMYPLWVTANTGNLPAKVSSTKLSFNPSTAVLTTTTFSGALSGNATTATDTVSKTGTGSIYVTNTSPTLVTPILGVAAATSINKVAITAPATSATLTIADGKTLTASNSITLAGTDTTTMTFPTTSATIARTDAAQTFTGTQTFSQANLTANAITASANAATVPITSGRNIVTNNSAATLTVTLTTTSAVNMQTCMVQILDFSAVAQTITWVNTENSTVLAPTTSNGSTTLPVTVGFVYNSATSKWRCTASA